LWLTTCFSPVEIGDDQFRRICTAVVLEMQRAQAVLSDFPYTLKRMFPWQTRRRCPWRGVLSMRYCCRCVQSVRLNFTYQLAALDNAVFGEIAAVARLHDIGQKRREHKK